MLLQLLELEDPVEDQMGFVYEKSAIVDAIRKANNPRSRNKLTSPIAGTNHLIGMEDLKPSKAIKREQKKARLAAAGGGGAAGRGRGRDDEVVLDA
jgi:hypothetical protein